MAKAAVNKFKLGDSARVVGRLSGHGTPIGTIVTISYVAPGKTLNAYNAVDNVGRLYSYRAADLASVFTSKEELQEFIESKEDEINTAKMKLKYLKETDSDTFNEDEFKIYNALTVLDGAKSKIEKARILREIING